ncbi:DNA-binding transcriptional LysR family regulator [Arthrobacter sp. 9AX]|uniref:LysR family transcriptional regulator n=1 Tax=Arthrobacter sp. 9AX TaxID=2653131 RepID=UPI0012EEE9C0|nr:LysR family transcriptional regulator [Arthrobacter sp. 9AX]VXC24431.1 DNA-binding transcriptional LysR family regulator [Arthrobacter sp. 9AX]
MELASFDMNLLVALDALLAEESVSRAAERLHIGQPAMSATLSRLRTSFRDPLLVRSGRGLRKTAFAESLQEPLTQALRDVEQLLHSTAEFDPGRSQRVFSIVTSDYVSLVLLRKLIERLAVVAPTVSVRVSPIGAEFLEQLRQGLVDLAIYPAELLPINAPFHRERLFEDDFVCATDIGNKEVGDSLTADQLSTLPYLAASQGALPSLADQRLDEAHIPRNTSMVAQSFVVAPFLLPGTRMYTIIQRRLADLLLPDAHFKILQPPVHIASIHELMIWSPRGGADAGHTWLRSQLRITAQQLS